MAVFPIFVIPLDTGINFSRIQKFKVKRGNKSCSNTLNPLSLAISINEQTYISCTIIYPIHPYFTGKNKNMQHQLKQYQFNQTKR